MVRDSRIKEYIFTPQTFSANGADATVYSDNPINGEILEVEWSYNRTGSVWLTLSGNSAEFFRRNAPSGTGVQITAPRRFSESTTGSIAGAEHTPFYGNDKLILNVLNAASGTQTLDVKVRYR